MELDPFSATCLQPPQMPFPLWTCPTYPWSLLSFCHCHWCIQVCLSCHPPPNQSQWRMASLFISFIILLSGRMKLQHLWLWTPCCHLRTQSLEKLPSWFTLSHPDFYQLQEPNLLLQTPSIKLLPSPLAPWPGRLWPHHNPCSWIPTCRTWRSLLLPWHPPLDHSRKQRNYPSSPLTLHQPHWHFPLPSCLVFLCLWSLYLPSTPVNEWIHSSCLPFLSVQLAVCWGDPHLQGPCLHTLWPLPSKGHPCPMPWPWNGQSSWLPKDPSIGCLQVLVARPCFLHA